MDDLSNLVQVLGMAVFNLAGWAALWYKLGKLEGRSHVHRVTERPPDLEDCDDH